MYNYGVLLWPDTGQQRSSAKWPVTQQHTVIINADVLQVLYKEVVWLKDFLKKPENHIYFNLSLGRKQYIITYISLHFILINISKLHVKNDHKF